MYAGSSGACVCARVGGWWWSGVCGGVGCGWCVSPSLATGRADRPHGVSFPTIPPIGSGSSCCLLLFEVWRSLIIQSPRRSSENLGGG